MNSRMAYAALALLSVPSSARGESDWFASVYTDEGIEVRADERVFTLYAVLNAMGYDEAPLARAAPVAKRELHPVRARLRGGFHLAPELAGELDAFFDAHPFSAEEYARYALSLGGPPGFERTSASAPRLQGFELLLARAYQAGGVAALFQQAYGEYRPALRSYHAVVDAPAGAIRRSLHLRESDALRIAVVVNLLDGQGKVTAATFGEELFVVVGPTQTPNLVAVATEVARAHLAGTAAARERKAGESAPALDRLARAFAEEALGLEARSGGEALELSARVRRYRKGSQPLESFVSQELAAAALASRRASRPEMPRAAPMSGAER
jgi:hypothetical protein